MWSQCGKYFNCCEVHCLCHGLGTCRNCQRCEFEVEWKKSQSKIKKSTRAAYGEDVARAIIDDEDEEIDRGTFNSRDLNQGSHLTTSENERARRKSCSDRAKETSGKFGSASRSCKKT
jgi:hypothetical protein